MTALSILHIGWLFLPLNFHVLCLRSRERLNLLQYPPFEKFRVLPEESKVDLGVIELTPMSTETVEVVDKAGNPVTNRWVAYITPELGRATRSAKTDSEGNFTTRVFGVQRPDSSPRWVIYPIGETKRSVDARTLPTLKIEKSKPWRLVLED